MANINEAFLNLEEDYLFSKVIEKMDEYKLKNLNAKIINLGIGDVTLPLAKTVIDAMNKATYEMASKENFKGYGPVQGYDFLIEKILKYEYEKRGVKFNKDEIFIASGTKGDLAGIAELFSTNSIVGIMEPVYPAYRDVNIMLGRKNIIYLKGTEENNFIPQIPKEHIDIIYLCSPNNPTGIVLNKEELTNWVDYAKKNNSVILFDSVYEAFIEDEDIPHSIYEIEGAKEVAIEFRSYSKLAGFTGVRSSFTVIPKKLKVQDFNSEKIELNSVWKRRQSTKFGAAPYITQRGAEAIYSEEGQKEIKENINCYKENARYMLEKLKKAGFTVYGGKNSPYIWLKTPNNMKSWNFFDKLLSEAGVVGTPGIGFGKTGEGYFRLTAFSSKEDTIDAINRITNMSSKE